MKIFELVDGSIIDLNKLSKISPPDGEWISDYGCHSHYGNFNSLAILDKIEVSLTMGEASIVRYSDTYEKIQRINEKGKKEADKNFKKLLKAWKNE